MSRGCRFLRPEDQAKRRSFADALAVLRDEAQFSGSDRATISIVPLPFGTRVASIAMLFETVQVTYAVLLPAAEQFLGSGLTNSTSRKFDVRKLARAVVDGTGFVLMSDGTELKAVEVIPARLPSTPIGSDCEIIKPALAANAQDFESFYRCLRYRAPGDDRDTLVRYKSVDFYRLAQEGKAASFKQFQRYIDKNGIPLGVSRQKYHETLAKVGLGRLWPRPGRRAAQSD